MSNPKDRIKNTIPFTIALKKYKGINLRSAQLLFAHYKTLLKEIKDLNKGKKLIFSNWNT